MSRDSAPSDSLPRKAWARPTKTFFVSMITRDISLEDSILDLIDNSADAALRREQSAPVNLTGTVSLLAYSVDVRFSKDEFVIEDTCGGLSLDDAAQYAFSFGRRQGAPASPYTVGVYGIGLKRAIFKMGSDIRIASTHRGPKDQEGRRPVADSFVVPIDVDAWLADTDEVWDFDIEENPPAEVPGLRVQIRRLGKSVSASFGDPSFLKRLRDSISRAYALHLANGLNIRVNGKAVDSALPSFMQAPDILPARVRSTDPQVPAVSVELIAGMAQSPSDGSEPDTRPAAESLFGWYVSCNGRFVVVADKTTLTAWGLDRLPQWHQQYAGFVGFVLFSSEDPSALPLTTTKRSIDVSSGVYLRTRLRMKDFARQWINYTNKRKGALNSAQKKEGRASLVPISDVAPQSRLKLPKLVPERPDPLTRVTYTVPSRQVVDLAQELGKPRASPNTVGKDAFDYCYRDLVPSDAEG